ncbi:MAG: glycosyltransferase family 1 protein [Acidobacteria bacterium]|nr:glycosyltransferase family 1 protein [Acidobacteriota bacterium]
MRILFCTDTYPPQVNGVSVVTALSVQGLRARGWDVEVIAPRYPTGTPVVFAPELLGDRLTSVPAVPLPGYADIRLAAPARGTVRDVIERFRPDVVHSATEFVIGRLGQRAALRRGLAVTTSYHTDFARYTESYGVAFLRRPVQRWIRRFHARAARIFTPSDSSRADLVALGLTDVEVWGRGVDDGLFHPSRRSPALRQRLSLGDAFTFLHVGRLAPEKGIAVLLAAFAIVEGARGPDAVKLVVAGAGPSLAALRARAPRNVTFLGNLDRQRELPALYASADAFLFASTTETLGLVVLEAMAAGLPVIATPAGGVADNLRDGENGLAFPAADAAACAAAMLRLVGDETLQRTLRDGARRWSQRRTWEHELDRLDTSYREVLSRSAR